MIDILRELGFIFAAILVVLAIVQFRINQLDDNYSDQLFIARGHYDLIYEIIHNMNKDILLLSEKIKIEKEQSYAEFINLCGGIANLTDRIKDLEQRKNEKNVKKLKYRKKA